MVLTPVFSISAVDEENLSMAEMEENQEVAEINGIAVQATATPTFNFPDFDVKKIDLSTIPDSIRELAKSPSGIQIVYVFSNNFYVVVADQVYPNLILEGTYSGQLFLNKSTWNGSSYSGGGKAGYLPGQSQTFYTTNPQCFIARYSWTKNDTLYSTITEDWKTPTIRTYASYYNSDSNKSGQYYLTPLSSATRDSYLFGACCAWLLNNSTVKIYDHMQIFPKIFTNGSWYCETQIESYSLTRHYFEYGQFPTLEDQREQTQKSILDNLKGLPGKINGFLKTLQNYLLWFNKDGSDSYTNPFSNLLDDIKTEVEALITQIDSFNDSLTETLNDVVDYIKSGSAVIKTFLTGVPIISTFVTFFLAFSVVRKVVGR